MIIYGTALLAVCHLFGIVLGELLGHALGVKANVGGVGIAMLMLIASRHYLHKSGLLNEASESGVHYWGAIYIPVVVAMAMTQNVIATPMAAKFLRLKTPRSAMVFGGLAGTVSGVSAELAATDRKLVPYGALVATFHTGLGCLLGPSLLYFIVRALVGN